MTVTVKDIRDFFRDRPQDNVTHLKEFFDKQDIDLATKMAGEAYLTFPPTLRNVTAGSAPDYLMLFGIAAFLLMIRINNLAINATPGVNEGNVQLSVGDEIDVLKSLHGTYMSMFSEMTNQYKTALDVRKALGSIGSPFRSNGPYGRKG